MWGLSTRNKDKIHVQLQKGKCLKNKGKWDRNHGNPVQRRPAQWPITSSWIKTVKSDSCRLQRSAWGNDAENLSFKTLTSLSDDSSHIKVGFLPHRTRKRRKKSSSKRKEVGAQRKLGEKYVSPLQRLIVGGCYGIHDQNKRGKCLVSLQLCFLHVFLLLLLWLPPPCRPLKPRIPEETVCGDFWHPPDWGFPPSRGRVNECGTQWAWFKCTNQHLPKYEPWLLSSSVSVGLIKRSLFTTPPK